MQPWSRQIVSRQSSSRHTRRRIEIENGATRTDIFGVLCRPRYRRRDESRQRFPEKGLRSAHPTFPEIPQREFPVEEHLQWWKSHKTPKTRE